MYESGHPLVCQTGFVPGRSIFDNIFMANKATSYALDRHQQLVIMLLDFDKAYDRESYNEENGLLSHMDQHGLKHFIKL